MARLSALLWHFTGRDEHLDRAREAMRYLASPDVARRFSSAATLLVDDDLRRAPLHVTIVGPRDDPRSRELVRTALAHPDAFKRVELWDRRDGPLPRTDVDYPSPEAPTAFVCRDGRCSAPLLTAAALSDRMSKQRGTAQ